MKIEVGDRVRALKGCRMADRDLDHYFYREGDTGVVRFADGLGAWVKWDNNHIDDGVWYANTENLTLIEEDMSGIDVLAVMEEAEANTYSALSARVRDARAAVAELIEAARCAADAVDVLLPLLSSEQLEVVCDAIAGADEARADILRALTRCHGGES